MELASAVDEKAGISVDSLQPLVSWFQKKYQQVFPPT
jgi:hypothetical protein